MTADTRMLVEHWPVVVGLLGLATLVLAAMAKIIRVVRTMEVEIERVADTRIGVLVPPLIVRHNGDEAAHDIAFARVRAENVAMLNRIEIALTRLATSSEGISDRVGNLEARMGEVLERVTAIETICDRRMRPREANGSGGR